MFRKIKQVINDHKAMNVIRKGNGDVHLVAFVGVNGNGWDCRLFQRDCVSSAHDPSDAILHANTLSSTT